MTIQDLIEATKNLALTEEDKARITRSLKEWDEKCLEGAKRMIATPEMLNQLYTL